jgi:hypothetical protein
MLHDGLPERRVVGHAGRVERRGVEGDEALPLLLGDAQAAVDGDEVGEPEFASEPVGAAEGLGGEGREVVDVLGLPGAEQRLQERVGERAVVEGPAPGGAAPRTRRRARTRTA